MKDFIKADLLEVDLEDTMMGPTDPDTPDGPLYETVDEHGVHGWDQDWGKPAPSSEQ